MRKPGRPRIWIPAVVLGVGCLLNVAISAQRSMDLERPLSAVALGLEAFESTDAPISEAELAVAGVASYLNRSYLKDSTTGFGIYVGYYPSQRQGKTIHSPKNCLPGAGWEPLESRREVLESADGTPIRVNRFVIAKQEQRAVVYYWYQGRGRTESNEYQVKLDLIRDAALRRRSEEALVRIVVPIESTDEAADALARTVATRLYASLTTILPG